MSLFYYSANFGADKLCPRVTYKSAEKLIVVYTDGYKLRRAGT